MHTLIIEGTFKPGKKTEFVIAWNNEILPTLKKQQGFVDEILLFWDRKARSWGGIEFLEDPGRSRALSPRSIPESGWFCRTPPEWSSHCALIRSRGGGDFSHSPGEGSLASKVSKPRMASLDDSPFLRQTISTKRHPKLFPFEPLRRSP